MAQKSVANLKDSVSGILQGLNLNNVKNLTIAIERTARQLAQKISIPTAMGRSNITLYDGVIDYLCPSDIFGSSIIDLRPQGITRYPSDFVYKDFITDFDRNKAYLTNGTEVTFESRKGTDIIRIVSTRPIPKIELDPMTATTGWVAAGSASGLVLDENVFYQQTGSLRFNLTGASTGTITKSTSSVDLTKYIGVGVIFLAFRTPSATDLTSIEVRIGSDSTNYYSVSNTTGFLGAWTTGDWMLVALDLAGATTTGTPVITAMDYSQVRITHAATLTNFYLGDLWIALPSPSTLLYETAAIFMASGANPSQSISTASDTIILNDAAYAIFEQECALTISKQQGGNLASPMVAMINQDLHGIRARNGVVIQSGLYDLYMADNPSQKVRTVGSWYDD